MIGLGFTFLILLWIICVRTSLSLTALFGVGRYLSRTFRRSTNLSAGDLTCCPRTRSTSFGTSLLKPTFGLYNFKRLQSIALVIDVTHMLPWNIHKARSLKCWEISDILLSASVVGFSIPDTSLPQYINIAYQILQMTLHIVLMTSKSIKWHIELNYGCLTPFLTTFQFYTVLVDET